MSCNLYLIIFLIPDFSIAFWMCIGSKLFILLGYEAAFCKKYIDYFQSLLIYLLHSSSSTDRS
jgi:hypothetical protein